MVEYKRVKLNELHKDPFNARLHGPENIADIRASLKQFGQVEPIVVQKSTGKIIGGNGRYDVMCELGWEECDVAYVETDDMMSVALGIALNRASERSTWDKETLDKLLGEIGDVNEELEQSFKELEEAVGIVEPAGEADSEPQIDKAAELQKKWGTETGQLWLIGKHRLLCGDSTKREDVERVMDGVKADMMFTDPPYGVNYEGGHFHSGDVGIKREREKLQADDTAEVYSRFLPVVLPFVDGPCYMWFAGSKAYDVYKAVIDNNCTVHALIIWHKTNATYAAMNAQYKQRHEPCLYFKPAKSTLRWCGPSDECTVWEEKRDAVNDMHPTQKPVVLPTRAISNHDAKCVLDAFSGSGTTFVASQNLNRICYGIEISPAYCAVILERIATAFPDLEIRQA